MKQDISVQNDTQAVTDLAQRGASLRRLRRQRLGAALSIELIMVLPILLIMLLAIVEFGILLMNSQGVAAAANLGTREAALASSTRVSVEAAVDAALARYDWGMQREVLLFVNGAPDPTGTLLADAPSGTRVSVTVNVPMDKAAPDLLKTFGVTIAGKELSTTYVTLKE